MAQTKTKSSGGTRSGGTARRSNGSQAASRTKTASRSGKRAAANRARSPKPKPAAASTKAQAVTEEGQEQASTLSEIASKAKTPLVAGGAAVAGLVGGIALTRNGSKKGFSIPKLGGKPKRSMPSMSMPKFGKSDSAGKALGATAKALGNTAKEIGKTGYRVGELTAEVRRVREQASAKD